MPKYPEPRSIFAGVDCAGPVILAVSGGSDSLALLHLAAGWAKTHDVELRVVTVDHGLRPEAAAEAAFVAGVCEGLNLLHYTLSWEGIKPTSGISNAARNARYMLMEEFAKDSGAREILTGHTSDDQAETLWMRNSRNGNNPQLRGMSGMANTMLLPSGVVVRRPLLKFERNTLRDYLIEIGQSWLEDPSNRDMAYERVRARRALVTSDISAEQISRFAELAGRQRRLNANAVTNLLLDLVAVENGPVFSVDRNVLLDSHENIASLALQVLVALAGGREHFIPHETTEKLLSLSEGGRSNVGNSIIECQKDSFVLYRENRNIDSLHVSPGDRVLWDNRLQIENHTDYSYLCAACTEEQLESVEDEHNFDFGRKFKAVLKSMPVLIREDGELSFPFLRGVGEIAGLVLTYRAPGIEFYCSEYDFSLLDVVRFVQREMSGMKMTGDH